MKVLVVCRGNTGRSPMLENVLRKALQDAGRQDISVESAGILKEAVFNLPPEDGAVIALEKEGINIKRHQSRWVGAINLWSFDTILCVTPEIKTELVYLRLSPHSRVTVICGHIGGIPDPYGKPQEAYEEVLRNIKEFVTQFIAEL